MRIPILLSLLLVGVGCNDVVDSTAADDGSPVAETESDLTSDPVVGGPTNGSCSDAKASLVYTAWQKEGGAAPPPGLVIGRTELVHDGKVVGRTTIREGNVGAEPGDNEPWSVALQFVAGTKNVLASPGNATTGSQTYAQKVKVTVDAGLPTANAFETYVLCNEQWNHLVP